MTATADVGARASGASEAPGPEPTEAIEPGDAADVARRDLFVLAAAALVLVPSIVAAVSALRHPWIPTNDWALIELRVREVGTGDTPLVGAYSRFGWKHPGPLPFYALALPYRLVPADRALLFATACVNLAATVGFALVVVRYPRTRALVALFGLAMLQRGMGIDQLGDPWNPTILIVPFALYLVLCIEIACGRQRWPLPVAAGVASFVVQAHVGLLQPVVLLGAVAIALRWQFGRSDRQGVPWRKLVPAVLVLGVAWLPPVIDQLNGSGNLGLLFRWARGDDIGGGLGPLTEGRMSGGHVVDSAAWLLDPTGMWVGRFQPISAFGSLLLGQGRPVTLLWVPLALGLALAAVRWAPGPMPDAYRRPTLVAALLATTGVVALFTDLLTAEGSPVFWPFRWVVAVVMLVWIALGWAVAGVVTQRFPWLDEAQPRLGGLSLSAPARASASAPSPAFVRLAGGAMVAAVALPVALAVGRGPVGRQPMQAASDALLELQPAIEEQAGRESLVVANSVDLLNDKDLGLAVVLERAGIDWVEYDDPRAVGHRRYMVISASAVHEQILMAAALNVGEIELVARSGPPGPGAPGSELLLIRSEPEAPPAVP